MAPALSTVKLEDEDVKRLILEALEVIRSDDFDCYFELFADDAVWMMPSSYHDVHLDEARSFYRFTKKFRLDQEASVDELVTAGDWAFVRISFDWLLAEWRKQFEHSRRCLRRSNAGWLVANRFELVAS